MATTPLGLNNGIYLETSEYKVGSHMDREHIESMIGFGGQMTDLGVTDFWIQSRMVAMPLYELSRFNKSTIDIDGSIYTWSVPLRADLPYIVEDVTDPTEMKPGIDGKTFQIKLSERTFGHGAIITYDKFRGQQIVITDEDIIEQAGGFVFTVRIIGEEGTNKWFDKRFLRPGTKYFRIGSIIGEYGQKFDDVETKAGERKFYNYVGTGAANKHLSVTKDADLMEMKSKILSIYQFKQGTKGDISVPGQSLMNVYGGDMMAAKNDVETRKWVPYAEALMIKELMQDYENYLMWGQGGRVNLGGASDERLPMGLYRQFDRGNVFTYNKKMFSLDYLENILLNLFDDRKPYGSARDIEIHTGRGGLKMVKKLMAQLPSSRGLIVNASDVKAVTGDSMSLHFQYEYESFELFLGGKVKFVLNPSLDVFEANEIENPYVDGYRLSSYTFLVFDLTDEGSENIKLIRSKNKWDMSYRIVEGRWPYMGKGYQNFRSSNNGPGYEVYVEKPYDAIWVKDPSRILKIEMENPFMYA
jgi:hypothetical protein